MAVAALFGVWLVGFLGCWVFRLLDDGPYYVPRYGEDRLVSSALWPTQIVFVLLYFLLKQATGGE